MTCFDITKGLCDEINSMVGRYRWSYQDKDNKIHWLSWETMTCSKQEGGLGYKYLYSFNLAILAKQGWRLLTNPDSLCARVMKAKYFPNCSVHEATSYAGISYAWCSILKGIDLPKQGIIKRVGDGTTVNIWTDPWLPRLLCRRLVTPKGHTIISKASELISPASETWDDALVRNTFWPQDANLILSMLIFEDLEDEWTWHFEEQGIFSVKSAYRLKRQLDDVVLHGQRDNRASQPSFDWSAVWKLDCQTEL